MLAFYCCSENGKVGTKMFLQIFVFFVFFRNFLCKILDKNMTKFLENQRF